MRRRVHDRADTDATLPTLTLGTPDQRYAGRYLRFRPVSRPSGGRAAVDGAIGRRLFGSTTTNCTCGTGPCPPRRNTTRRARSRTVRPVPGSAGRRRPARTTSWHAAPTIGAASDGYHAPRRHRRDAADPDARVRPTNGHAGRYLRVRPVSRASGGGAAADRAVGRRLFASTTTSCTCGTGPCPPRRSTTRRARSQTRPTSTWKCRRRRPARTTSWYAAPRIGAAATATRSVPRPSCPLRSVARWGWPGTVG